jgi:hypothetical protein
MNDPLLLIGFASTALLASALASIAALRGWGAWLDLRRLQVNGQGGYNEPSVPSPSPSRIELAAMRERVRRLEAIASGVDL